MNVGVTGSNPLCPILPGALIYPAEIALEQIAFSDNRRIAGVLGAPRLSQEPFKTTPESGR